MPIRQENRHRYPADWPEISKRLRSQAHYRCQWCDAENGSTNPKTGSTVVLTVAHLNHIPEDCRDNNLAVLCQRCHLGYDMRGHQRNRVENKARAERETAQDAGQLELFELPTVLEEIQERRRRDARFKHLTDTDEVTQWLGLTRDQFDDYIEAFVSAFGD